MTTQEKTRTKDTTKQHREKEFDPFAIMRSCCASSEGELPTACPCKAMFKRHRVAAITVLAVFGLGVVAVHVGAVLGIMAFFGVS